MNPKRHYLEFCERNFAKEVDDIRVWKSSHKAQQDVSALIWHDCPDPGVMTAVSFGLSAVNHPEWAASRLELMLRLETNDVSWAISMAYFIHEFRNEKPFEPLTILTMDEPISDESTMCGFFVSEPPLLDSEACICELDEYPIQLGGFYPIYLGEADLIESHGIDRLLTHRHYDVFSVTRPDVSLESSDASGAEPAGR